MCTWGRVHVFLPRVGRVHTRGGVQGTRLGARMWDKEEKEA